MTVDACSVFPPVFVHKPSDIDPAGSSLEQSKNPLLPGPFEFRATGRVSRPRELIKDGLLTHSPTFKLPLFQPLLPYSTPQPSAMADEDDDPPRPAPFAPLQCPECDEDLVLGKSLHCGHSICSKCVRSYLNRATEHRDSASSSSSSTASSSTRTVIAMGMQYHPKRRRDSIDGSWEEQQGRTTAEENRPTSVSIVCKCCDARTEVDLSQGLAHNHAYERKWRVGRG